MYTSASSRSTASATALVKTSLRRRTITTNTTNTSTSSRRREFCPYVGKKKFTTYNERSSTNEKYCNNTNHVSSYNYRGVQPRNVRARYYTPGRISIKDMEKSGASPKSSTSSSAVKTESSTSTVANDSGGGGGVSGTLLFLILLSGGAGALLTDGVTVVQDFLEGKRKDLNIKYTGIPLSMDGIDVSNPIEAIQSLISKKQETSPPSVPKVEKDKSEMTKTPSAPPVKTETKKATSDKVVLKAEVAKEKEKDVTEAELVEAEKVMEETLAATEVNTKKSSVSVPKKTKTEETQTTPKSKKELPSDIDKISYTSKEEISHRKRSLKPVSSRLMIDDDMGEASNAAAKAQMMKNQPLLSDLENLSRSELQARLVSAVNEMAEIRRYQIALVNDTIRQTEREVVAAKKEEIDYINRVANAKIAKNKALTQEELEFKLKSLEDKKEEEKKELKKEFEQQKELLDAEIENKWKTKFEQQVASEQGKIQKDIAQKVDSIGKKIHASYSEYVDKCQADIALTIEKVNQIYLKLAENQDSSHVSDRIHKINLASHALEIRSQDFAIVKEEIEGLVSASKGDPVLAKVMNAMVSSPHFDTKKEQMTLEQLRARFPTAYKATRQAAFIPDENEWIGSGMLGHIYSTIVEYVTIAPVVETGGIIVKVEGANKNDLILARAKYFINEGDILSTAQELKKLEGAPALVMSDWLSMAQNRLELEQTMKVVNARSRIINATMM